MRELRKYYGPIVQKTNAVDACIKKAEAILESEKIHIQDAFDVGQANWDPKCRDVSDGKEYYSQLYDNVKKVAILIAFMLFGIQSFAQFTLKPTSTGFTFGVKPTK